MKPEYDSKSTDDPELVKELTLQVRKVIGPFAAPKKIVSGSLLIRDDLSSTFPNDHLALSCFHALNDLNYAPMSHSLELPRPSYLVAQLTYSTSSPTFPRLEVERSCDES